MKILYIDSPIDPPGGGQISLLNILLFPEFEKKVFLDSHGTFSNTLSKKNIPFEIVDSKSLYKKISEYSPDIIHCNSATTYYSFKAALAAFRLKIPFIWHLRVTEKAFLKDDIIAFLSSRIIAISKVVRDKLNPMWRKKTEIVYNSISPDFLAKIPPEEIKKELNLKENDKLIGVFSRFIFGKGHDLFISSAIDLLEYNSNLKFLLVGDGELKDEIERRIISSRWGMNFIFTGHKENIADYMNACDVVVSPSTLIEGFGRVLIEAMSLGKPVVATSLGGHLEIIKNGFDGFLCIPVVKSMSESIQKALSADENLKKRAFEKSRAEFSFMSQFVKLKKIYMDVYENSN